VSKGFNGRLRDELLNETLFTSLAQARVALGVGRLQRGATTLATRMEDAVGFWFVTSKIVEESVLSLPKLVRLKCPKKAIFFCSRSRAFMLSFLPKALRRETNKRRCPSFCGPSL
jgi:hypothetical protein